MSINRDGEKFNCTGEERQPVSFLVAVRLDHSVAAPQNIYSFMEEMGGVSMMVGSLVGFLCSTTSSKVANQELTTKPALLICSFRHLASFDLMPVMSNKVALTTTDL